MMKLVCSLFITLLYTISFGQITNTRGGVWSDVTVWSNNTTPSINDTVSLSYDIIIDTVANCKVFNTNGHSVTVYAGFNFNVTGNNLLPDSTFIDSRDGQVYTFRHIGTQTWMTKNINYNVSGSWCYDDSAANCDIYGRLYTWNTALSVSPPGWHLPSADEWTMLTDFLGGGFGAGGPMKAINFWDAPNAGATNSSGFTALPAGYWHYSQFNFQNIGMYGYWWSSTGDVIQPTGPQSKFFILLYNSVYGYVASMNQLNGVSVRCVRD